MNYFREEKYFEPKVVTFIKSKKAGYVSFKSSAEFGLLAIELKAGRKVKTDKLNYHNGLKLLVKHGDKVEQYDEIMEIYSDSKLPTEFLERLYDNFEFHDEPIEQDPTIIDELK
jgi:thymidine phosphorylase